MKDLGKWVWKQSGRLFHGIKFCLGWTHLDAWMARRDAAANLQLARELKAVPGLESSAAKLEASALRVLERL